MTESHETASTEMLDGETWCSECKEDVTEWKVSFESGVDADGGSNKVRRCPHCNAVYFKDRDDGFETLWFFGGLMIFVGYIWSAGSIGLGANLNDSRVAILFLILALTHGLAISSFATKVRRHFALRKRTP